MEIIDSHIHWGASLALPGVDITTQELLRQAEESGVDRMVIFPFPSTAIADRQINEILLMEAEVIDNFIPYYYIPDDLLPIPSEKGFYGGKWHWVRGVQDCSSNYDVLKDPGLGKDAVRFKGLCTNCESRHTCGGSRVAGGVWHCEEYC